MREREILQFSAQDHAALLDRMAELALAHRGWINFEPEVVDEGRRGASLFHLFAAPGPSIPVCSWVPGKLRRDRVEPTSVGLQHGAGPKVVAHLSELGIEIPPEWRVVQDHPKRGLVALVPADAGHEDVVGWLMEAARRLCESPPTGRWEAVVFP